MTEQLKKQKTIRLNSTVLNLIKEPNEDVQVKVKELEIRIIVNNYYKYN